MIRYDDCNLQITEREILGSYHRKDYSQVQCLCKVRKEMLNAQAMSESNTVPSRFLYRAA